MYLRELSTLTVNDCVEMYETKGTAVVINDGKITGLAEENTEE